MMSFEKASRIGGSVLDEFIRRENIALFRKKLADPGLSDRQRKTISAPRDLVVAVHALRVASNAQ
jgi:hypothetical protein